MPFTNETDIAYIHKYEALAQEHVGLNLPSISCLNMGMELSNWGIAKLIMNYTDHSTNPHPITTYIQRYELCGIHINIYLPSSPGASAKKSCQPGKNVESCNFKLLWCPLNVLVQSPPNNRGGNFSIEDGPKRHQLAIGVPNKCCNLVYVVILWNDYTNNW